MPVYNGAEFLRPAVESILAQTFADFELVLSDDGSKDDSRQIIEEYARRDPRVVVSLAEHGGISVATNRALQIARGEYFAPMDQDDIALPNRPTVVFTLYSKLHGVPNQLTSYEDIYLSRILSVRRLQHHVTFY